MNSSALSIRRRHITRKQSTHHWIPLHTKNLEDGSAKEMKQFNVLSGATKHRKRSFSVCVATSNAHTTQVRAIALLTMSNNQILLSKRGKPLAVHVGYSYTVERSTNNKGCCSMSEKKLQKHAEPEPERSEIQMCLTIYLSALSYQLIGGCLPPFTKATRACPKFPSSFCNRIR
jgi:hypothetical protein